MTAASLSRERWVEAALGEMLRAGPEAVAVQPVARVLGATKGSFYWHFDGRDDLLAEVLAAWVDRSTVGMIERVERSGLDPRGRLLELLDRVTEAAAAHRGELLVLAGVGHPLVAEAVARTTERRVGYVAELLRATGRPPADADRRAVLGYATYLGFAHLAAAAPGVLPATADERRLLLAEMTTMMVG